MVSIDSLPSVKMLGFSAEEELVIPMPTSPLFFTIIKSPSLASSEEIIKRSSALPLPEISNLESGVTSPSPTFLSLRSCITTSLPPYIVDGIGCSFDEIRNLNNKQKKREDIVKYFKQTCLNNKIKLIKNNFENSHIQSIFIGCPYLCQKISDILLYDYNHYIQPIKYPTVELGTERLRISLKYFHTKKNIDSLIYALNKINNKMYN